VLVVSPTAVYSTRRFEPTLPDITGSLLSLTPMRKPSPSSAARSHGHVSRDHVERRAQRHEGAGDDWREPACPRRRTSTVPLSGATAPDRCRTGAGGGDGPDAAGGGAAADGIRATGALPTTGAPVRLTTVLAPELSIYTPAAVLPTAV
jgi:hypothetical protein